MTAHQQLMRMEVNWVFWQVTTCVPSVELLVTLGHCEPGKLSIVYMTLPNDTTANPTTPETEV